MSSPLVGRLCSTVADIMSRLPLVLLSIATVCHAIELSTAATLDAACASRSACISAYSTLQQSGQLTAFGRSDMPLQPTLAKSLELAKVTGLRATAFAPKPRGEPRGLRLAPLEAAAALLVGQLCFASGALMDEMPLRSLRELEAPQLISLALSVLVGSATVLFVLDKLLLQERLLGVLRLIVPSRREAVVRHEAGHFLCAYSLGVPVQACRLNPLGAPFDPRWSEASAGTIFLSPAIECLQEGRRADEDDVLRAAIVLAGGIAAEALWAGSAEGGAADEATLRALLSKHAAPAALSEQVIRERARWAAASAVLLLRQRAAAYDALCDAMREGRSVGECVMAIERAVQAGGSSMVEEVAK